MIAVLIPTYRRPEKLQALLMNIHEATETPHHVYFIVENTDEPTKRVLNIMVGDYTAVYGDFGSCARAMNAGYQASTEPYLHTGNDDLRYHGGWDLEALAVNQPIVGTNDGHGRMTCFAFVWRSYIEEHSGVFDRPNTLYHEYASQYVDTELAEYAKARGVWGEAPDSITEHMHWEFGEADRNHPNYLKAADTCAADAAIYEQRSRAWLG